MTNIDTNVTINQPEGFTAETNILPSGTATILHARAQMIDAVGLRAMAAHLEDAALKLEAAHRDALWRDNPHPIRHRPCPACGNTLIVDPSVNCYTCLHDGCAMHGTMLTLPIQLGRRSKITWEPLSAKYQPRSAEVSLFWHGEQATDLIVKTLRHHGMQVKTSTDEHGSAIMIISDDQNPPVTAYVRDHIIVEKRDGVWLTVRLLPELGLLSDRQTN